MAFIPKFEELQREACKASIMLEGLTGKGKSGLALMLGYGLAGGFKEGISEEDKVTLWKKIATVDTENRSLNLFVGLPASFGGNYGRPLGLQITPQDGYKPSNYLMSREAAIVAKAEVYIADSITHMWTAKGGVLDMVSEAKAKDSKMDNYRVWGLPEVMKEKQNLIDVIRDNRCHVITTVRTKEKMALEFNTDKGKNEVVSMGEQQLQQEGLKYEADLVLKMLQAGKVNADGTVENPRVYVVKSRYAMFAPEEEYSITPQMCEQLRAYLAEGADLEEILEAQRKEYIAAVSKVLDASQSKRNVWNIIKEEAGLKDEKLADISLYQLKQLYSQLVG